MLVMNSFLVFARLMTSVYLNYSVLIPDYESTAELLNLLISDCKVSKNNIIKFVEYEF